MINILFAVSKLQFMPPKIIKYASVAQSVEQRIRNAQVGGSSPFTSSSGILPPLISGEVNQTFPDFSHSKEIFIPLGAAL